MAAVAAVLGPRDELLLIRRADREGDPWSGHFAFPGGHREPADPSLRAAAERETREEIGLDLASARFLGALDALAPITRSGRGAVAVAPFVYAVDRWPDLALSNEVAAVHPLGLDRFVSQEGRGTFPYSWQGRAIELPCVRLEGTLIWGLTLRMIDDLVSRLEG